MWSKPEYVDLSMSVKHVISQYKRSVPESEEEWTLNLWMISHSKSKVLKQESWHTHFPKWSTKAPGDKVASFWTENQARLSGCLLIVSYSCGTIKYSEWEHLRSGQLQKHLTSSTDTGPCVPLSACWFPGSGTFGTAQISGPKTFNPIGYLPTCRFWSL